MADDKLILNLTDSICWKIASQLDVRASPNWRTLISVMPKNTYNEKKIMEFYIEILKPCGSPTLALLTDLGKKKKTVGHLIGWLSKIDANPSLVKLLRKGDAGIRESSPKIVSQPKAEIYEEGQDIDIFFQVDGEQPLNFQWFKGAMQLHEQTKNNLFIPTATLENSGHYTCRVSNNYGFVFTDWTKIRVCNVQYIDFNEPLITMHPRSSVYIAGDTLELYADAVGNPAPHLQWYRDDELLLSQCSRSLIIHNVQPGTHDGLYKLKASNKHGAVTSMPSQVTITKGSEKVRLPSSPTEEVKNTIDHNVKELGGRGIYDGENTGVSILPPVLPTEKVALLIGNEAYTQGEKLGPLVHPVNDTYDVTASLLSLDFKVVSLINLDLKAMEKAVQFFYSLIDTGTYAVFYFAGHGFEINGESYLMPIDATDQYKLSENYPVSKVLKAMTDEKRQAKLSVLLLDCCRTEPELCRRDPMMELRTSPTQRKNVIIGYGCCSNARVLESPEMRNGYFAAALNDYITKDIKIDDVLWEVSKAIHQGRIIDPATGRTQVVYRHSTVVEDLRLTQQTQANLTGHISQQRLLWQQAHIAPDSPVKILEGECGIVELIFTAQFSNCLLIQSNVKKALHVSTYNIIFTIADRIGGAHVEIISPTCEKEEKLSEKIVRISNLEHLHGNIDIHLKVTFEQDDKSVQQLAYYSIKEKPLYAKVVEKLDTLLQISKK